MGDVVKGGPSDIEPRLLSLCTQALSMDAVKAEDNFFELGGDSLSAMWLLSSIQDEFGVEIPLAELFDAQTMNDVITVVKRHLAPGASIADAAS